MNRIDRLFGIMILLQSKKHASLEKIAAKFQISGLPFRKTDHIDLDDYMKTLPVVY